VCIDGCKDRSSFRLFATEHATNSILWPKLANFLPQYPDIGVEIIIDNGLTDIVAQRYDAGVRLGTVASKASGTADLPARSVIQGGVTDASIGLRDTPRRSSIWSAWTPADFDFDRDFESLEAKTSATFNAADADVSRFAARGRKLICAYPKHATLRPGADPLHAESYSCVDP
jgi:hypothetical protein